MLVEREEKSRVERVKRQTDISGNKKDGEGELGILKH